MAIFVDLDGTLAKWEGYKGVGVIGEPVPAMMDRVRNWLADGKVVKIFTARASREEEIPFIKRWLTRFGLEDLEITCIKSYDAEEFWDDRAVTVIPNTGVTLEDVFKLKAAELGDRSFLKYVRELFNQLLVARQYVPIDVMEKELKEETDGNPGV